VNSTSTFNNTITVSSNVGFIGKSGSGTGGNWRYISDDGTSRWLSGILGSPSETSFDIYDIVNGRSLLTLTAAGVVKVPQTTASTTTSSGALVVGNGTSGGLGVGGSVVLGANLVSTASDGKIQITGTGNTTGNKEISLQRSDAADSFAIGLTGSAYAGALTGLGNNEAFIYNSSASAFRIFLGTASTNRFDFTSSQFKINPTTASTSTSSGALVVSGGVGVAGALNVGEAVTVAGGSFAAASFYKSASLGTVLSGATGSSYDLYITNPSGNHVMQVPTGTRNAEFAATLTTVGAITSGASISTSAPTGGSGAWELGVYSATAPSATGYVTIEIGGVAYKLLASNV
jgi:hypothetical protein